jgi:hypothetical protein
VFPVYKTALQINRTDFILALTPNAQNWDEAWFLDKETGELWLNSNGINEAPDDPEDNPRYLPIEAIASHDAFQIMEDFVDELGDSQEAGALQAALNGRKPFRRFKDALLDYPELRDRWFAFEETRLIRLAEAWCDQQGVDVEWVELPQSVGRMIGL